MDNSYDAAWQASVDVVSGTLPVQQLQHFLELVQLQAAPEQLQAALQQLPQDKQELTRDEVATLCHTLLVAPGGPLGPLAAHHSSSMMAGTQASHNSSSSCKQQLPGMGSQQPGLQQQSDDAMLAYMQRLEEHRKRCDLSGRYAEAAAAAKRMQDLKAAQAERLQGQLAVQQHSEICQLQERYQQETQLFDQQWRERVAAYEAGVAGQLATLRAAHEAQLADFLLQAEVRRPGQPQHSADYLNSRKVEEVLVKQGQYRKAHELKVAADAMYHEELASTQAAWDSEVALRKTRLQAKQQGELDVLLQRAARGRDELELRRRDEAGKRGNRFRCMVQELDGMQRLEALHLQHFLEGSALPGKYMPLRDSTFKRKRELLGL